ncbi:PTS sugar transporter subunit IIB [Collinsella sp. AGMB00827]|uniref:PTS sugar transporter subunit IIB n=1 Tax=Collinsella ureilytica TaxID=2869515 RepID=A0ABS7MHZ0_9ACTN|nr:PTS sugar transporter subunit IIB [Collinsella urealyticum]MBY4796907.1 PTS sugar transporter subunit IIB [Collinsella urealyticum]
MAIVFSRIDDRLLHGQVVTTWLKRYEIEQAIIVSDEVSRDATRQAILKMAAPQGLKVVCFSPSKLVEVLQKTEVKRQTMLIFTNPREVWECVEGGIKIDFLNVGNMSKTETNEKVTAGVALTEEDRTYFGKLIDAGIKIEVQMVPTDKIEEMKDVLGR